MFSKLILFKNFEYLCRRSKLTSILQHLKFSTFIAVYKKAIITKVLYREGWVTNLKAFVEPTEMLFILSYLPNSSYPRSSVSQSSFAIGVPRLPEIGF